MISIAGLVLAAGESRRMGRDKALLTYQERPFLEIILGNLREAGVEKRLVVLGHHAEIIRALVRMEGAEVIYNADYPSGQTSSLQAGLRVIDAGSAAGVLMCLVDHPAAGAQVMRELVAAFERTGAPVAVPAVDGRRGHPVLIGRALFSELLALNPEQGANSLLAKYQDVTCLVPVLDGGVLLDIDTMQDYQALTRADWRLPLQHL